MYLSQASARKLAQEILPGLNVQTNKVGYRQIFLPINWNGRLLKMAYGLGHTWQEALEGAKQTKEKLDKEHAEHEEAKKVAKEAIQEAFPEKAK